MMMRVEAVFHLLMSKEGIARHGIGIVNDICYTLSQEDIGFEAFVPKAVARGVYLEAVLRFMQSFGKGYVGRIGQGGGAQRGYILNETIHATLGVIAAEGKSPTPPRPAPPHPVPPCPTLLHSTPPDFVGLILLD